MQTLLLSRDKNSSLCPNKLQGKKTNIPITYSYAKNPTNKRIFDFLFASGVAILLLSWILPIIGVLIKLESRGPVFFKQKRTGKDGKPFMLIKLRSMRMNLDADSKQATKGDRRITMIGAFIRKTSIDELPQFLNVLAGHMSVVGPRPHMIRHTEEYSQAIHNFMDRHVVAPGITGLAQVSGLRGEIMEIQDMEKRVKVDIHYLRNRSFRLDLMIIFRTVAQVFIGNAKVF